MSSSGPPGTFLTTPTLLLHPAWRVFHNSCSSPVARLSWLKSCPETLRIYPPPPPRNIFETLSRFTQEKSQRILIAGIFTFHRKAKFGTFGRFKTARRSSLLPPELFKAARSAAACVTHLFGQHALRKCSLHTSHQRQRTLQDCID